jgi:hypothetical protein
MRKHSSATADEGIDPSSKSAMRVTIWELAMKNNPVRSYDDVTEAVRIHYG